MKKILMMAFVSVAMLAAVSCSKDDEKDSSTPASIKGTLWETTVEYADVPILGSGSVEAQLYFKSDDICRFDVDLPAAVQMALSTMGVGDLSAGEYGYTFDGKKVAIDAMNGVELEYTGSTLVYRLPSQFNVLASYIGGSEVVFRLL